ncbi:hypothetical protein WJX81_004095 [Elliptochloris bilobata]|uniref:U-box domain-containing protein n=1 Tax=Elliptochloris bilobata TaxID=381761 RepID=A0AAW1R1R4_9CHLO
MAGNKARRRHTQFGAHTPRVHNTAYGSLGIAHGHPGGQPTELKANAARQRRRRGRCTHGDLCWLCHSQEELEAVRRQGTALSPDEAAKRHPAYKTRMCEAYDAGRCQRGAACTFAHGAGELRRFGQPSHGTALSPDEAAKRNPSYKTRTCEAYDAGRCQRGAACTFAHGASELRRFGQPFNEAPPRAAQQHVLQPAAQQRPQPPPPPPPRPQQAQQLRPQPVSLPQSPLTANELAEFPPLGGRSSVALDGHMLGGRRGREASIPGTEAYADAAEGRVDGGGAAGAAAGAAVGGWGSQRGAARSSGQVIDQPAWLPPLDLSLGDGADDDAIDCLACPITHEVLREPVVAADGWTYERSAIEMWLQSHDTSPMTNDRMPDKVLIPNKSLREAIQLIYGIKRM